MSIGPELLARLREMLDVGAATALLKRAVGTPSVTGTELAFAELLAGELRGLGAESVSITDFAPGRPNVGGLLRGTGGGPCLLLIGHTDTVHEFNLMDTSKKVRFSAAIRASLEKFSAPILRSPQTLAAGKRPLAIAWRGARPTHTDTPHASEPSASV